MRWPKATSTSWSCPQSSKDVLGTAFDEMGANLRDLVGQVQSSAVTLAETSAQLGSAANQTGLPCSR